MEQLLHYVWKHKLFPLTALCTTSGKPVEVIDPGLHNRNAGPDFFNAKVKIDGTLWVGNVEIHDKASDWYVHRHDKVFLESPVVVFAVAQLALYETHQLNGSFQTQTFVGGTIDVLMEHISHSLLLQPQSRVELIVTLQRCLVLQIHPRHDSIHSLAVHLGKAQSTFLQKEVPGVLHIVQVVGIVDDSLYVALIVAHFHLGLKYVFHNLYVAYFDPKNPLFEDFISKSLQK